MRMMPAEGFDIACGDRLIRRIAALQGRCGAPPPPRRKRWSRRAACARWGRLSGSGYSHRSQLNRVVTGTVSMFGAGHTAQRVAIFHLHLQIRIGERNFQPVVISPAVGIAAILAEGALEHRTIQRIGFAVHGQDVGPPKCGISFSKATPTAV